MRKRHSSSFAATATATATAKVEVKIEQELKPSIVANSSNANHVLVPDKAEVKTEKAHDILDIKNEVTQSDAAHASSGHVKESAKEPIKGTIKEYTLKGRTFTAQLFNDLPDVTETATSSFTVIDECIYSTKLIGDSGQEEIMTCDCHPRWDGDSTTNHACDEDSDCINRLTSIECRNDHCTCGNDCQNQRFQKRQYANIDVIMTEKKGFGLRAKQDIPAGSFIQEYVGEVIGEDAWRKRREKYEKEGIKHFYFMMLQMGEFIDATKKANVCRFANHSCRPNCVVEKWVVKDKLRMGLFSTRTIFKGEEITFDYNVDRYGAEAQPCYCGESNCIGVLGGKTQTDAANKLPQLLVDALGLDDEDEDNWITVTAGKKKRGKKGQSSEELDAQYAANLPVKSIEKDAVSKVMSSLLQVQEEWLVIKLVERIHITNDPGVDLQVMRMHGYQIFGNTLKQWRSNEQITICILEILSRWPKMSKNKISSSQIESTVKELAANRDSPIVSQLAKSILKEWGELKMAYRIPRRERAQKSETPDKEAPNKDPSAKETLAAPTPAPTPAAVQIPIGPRKSLVSTPKSTEKLPKTENRRLPPGWKSEVAPNGKTYYFNEDRTLVTWDWPGTEAVKVLEREKKEALKQNMNRAKLQENVLKIIEAASKSSTVTPPRDSEGSETSTPREKINSGKDRHSVHFDTNGNGGSADHKGASNMTKSNGSTNHHHHPKELPVDKQLTKTFAKYVPNAVSKYESEIGHDAVKQISREIVHILVEKEMKSGHDVKNPSELTEHRKARVKKFIKDYMAKVLAKIKAKREAKKLERQGSASADMSPAAGSGAVAKLAKSSADADVSSSIDSTSEPPTKKQKIKQEADIDLGDDEDYEF